MVFVLCNNGVEEEANIWIFMGSLFLCLIIANLFGGCTTVLSARKRTYVAFIVLRSSVELTKIVLILLMWLTNHFLWQDDALTNQA